MTFRENCAGLVWALLHVHGDLEYAAKVWMVLDLWFRVLAICGAAAFYAAFFGFLVWVLA